MSKKQDKENNRIRKSLEWLHQIFQDEEFIKNTGLYIKNGESYINTKFEELNYSKSDNIDIKTYAEAQSEYLKNNSEYSIEDEVNAIFFLVPLTAVIALNPIYHSNRVILNNDLTLNEAYTVTVINAVENVGKDNTNKDALIGISFALLGYRTSKRIEEINITKAYLSCVEYLNDFITAYKLLRHDHTVKNVTSRSLPSYIEYYEQQEKELSNKKLLEISGNDLADLWSKRLPSEHEFDDLKKFAEYLPTNKSAHYILRIGERSIENICLGQYEDAIINSDRFAEFVLRDILRQTLNLSFEELSEYRSMYSTNKKHKAVIQTLANKLDCKGSSIIPNWYSNSRKSRNSIIHSLEIE